MTLHRGVHPDLDVEGCFPCRIASVSIAASALPTRKPEAAHLHEREGRWVRENDAYRRLVKDGLQPRSLNGADEIEKRATTEHEVTNGLHAPRTAA